MRGLNTPQSNRLKDHQERKAKYIANQLISSFANYFLMAEAHEYLKAQCACHRFHNQVFDKH